MEKYRKVTFVPNKDIIEEFKKGPNGRLKIFSFLKFNLLGLPYEVIETCLENIANRGDEAIEKFVRFAEEKFLLVDLDPVELEENQNFAREMFKNRYHELTDAKDESAKTK